MTSLKLVPDFYLWNNIMIINIMKYDNNKSNDYIVTASKGDFKMNILPYSKTLLTLLCFNHICMST